MAVVWTIIAMLINMLIFKYFNSKEEQNEKRNSSKHIINTSIIIGLLVFSHLVIDLIGWSITGDGIPLLFDDSQTIKLEISEFAKANLLIITFVVEIGPLILGFIIYVHYLIKQKRKRIYSKKLICLQMNQKLKPNS